MRPFSNVNLTTARLTLRPLRMDDAESLLGIYSDPEFTAREYWRQGYMFEAVGALLKLAFEDLGLNRLEADVDPRNTASARSLEKLGFKREGYLRERWIVGEDVSDSALYGLLAREWRATAPDPISRCTR